MNTIEEPSAPVPHYVRKAGIATRIKDIWALEYVPLIVVLISYFLLNVYTAFTARYGDFIGSDMAFYFERPI